jgi:hypothetical protein
VRSRATFARKLIAAATGAAMAAAGLIALGHQIEERHEVCAEHGELIHVSADAAEAAPVTAGTRSAAWLSDSPLDLDHGDHCAVHWSAPQSPDLIAAATTSIHIVARPNAVAVTDRAPAAVALWRLAPKTSPPA